MQGAELQVSGELGWFADVRLITFLSREDSVKSLLHWVTSGLDELNEQASKAEESAFDEAVASKDVYPPFTGDKEETPAEDHGEGEGEPIAPGLGIGLGEGFAPVEETNTDMSRAK